MAARVAPALLLLISNASAQSDGTLDPTFGFGGLTTVFFDLGGTNRDIATDVAIQPDGKIVVVGYADFSALGDTDFAIARLLPSGELDPSFDGDGKRTVYFDLGGDKADQAFAVALQTDGKIIVAGRVRSADHTFDPALVRLLSNGSLDTTFGSGGRLVFDFSTNFQDSANAVRVQPNGRILVAGRQDDLGFVMRLLSNGTSDATFTTVLLGVSPGGYAAVTDLALASSGSILVAANTYQASVLSGTVCRYLASGLPDPEFGCWNLGPRYDAQSIAVHTDGTVLAGGTFTTMAGQSRAFFRAFTSTGAAYNPFSFVFNMAGASAQGTDVAWLPDGKIVLFGQSSGLGRVFAVARLFGLGGGTDPSFDRNPEVIGTPGDGRVLILHSLISTAFSDAAASRMAVRRDGRAILVGTVCLTSDCSGDADFMIQRLNVRNDILVDSFE